MNDAVIVADLHDHVVDLNPAAGQVLDLPSPEVVGAPLAVVAPELGALIGGYGKVDESQREVELGDGPGGAPTRCCSRR